MEELDIREKQALLQKPEDVYRVIRGYVVDAQRQVYSAVNGAMVLAYWKIGREIYQLCGESDRAAYGKQQLQLISEKLSKEFGKGFDISNLRNMRQFYLVFPKRDTLCPELSWSHYRLLMHVSDEEAREFYQTEAVRSGWSLGEAFRL